ncbi:MAG: type II toxin-antitoxin system Phd/YefM family antitoxin [SAR324 cluster bacterium]|nr:type II toxin-antitoxin system Phd/YefM family antitoxin [SAR324 cluster bacterium]
MLISHRVTFNDGGSVKRIKTNKARDEFGSVVNRVAYGKERIILQRRNKDMAAMIPMEDLRLLERLIEAEEDRIDLEKVRKAMAEPGENVPYEQVRKELGLDAVSPGDEARSQKGAKHAAKG